MRIVVLASGSGSNFEAIAKASLNQTIKSTVTLLIVDKKDAYAITRAKKLNIPYEIVEIKNFQTKQAYETHIVNLISKKKADLICLAGYMKIVSQTFLEAYEGKIINIHPSLLPKYPGKNGLLDALNAGETTIGATVHYVNQYIDDGEIIKQISFSTNNLSLTEIEETLHKNEHILYIDVIKQLEEEHEKSIN